jgi:DNA modification methylase
MIRKGATQASRGLPTEIELRTESGQGSHSAPFPRLLVEFFIKAFSDPGDVVFDPFCGSGTTLAAAFGLGRSAFGCELSPAYTDVIVRRIQNLSSQNFHLDGDGRSFEEIKLERTAGSSKQSEVVAA